MAVSRSAGLTHRNAPLQIANGELSNSARKRSNKNIQTMVNHRQFISLQSFVKLLLVLSILFITWSFRGYYTEKFEPSYWEHKYAQSQWRLPLSPRIIGDDGLYLAQGIAMVKGADPALLNAEVPPFGKYVIGFVTQIFGNHHVYGLLIMYLVVCFYYLLCKQIINPFASLAATLLFVWDPLILSQWTVTMMDSLQLLLLLIIFYALHLSIKKNIYTLPSITIGLTLGLFSATKFPLLTPSIFFLISYYFVAKHKYLSVITMGICTILAYIATYTQYFLVGHTIIDLLKVQKYMMHFYRSSGVLPTFGSALLSLAIGMQQNLFTRKFEFSHIYTPTWLFFSGFYLYKCVRSIRSHTFENNFLYRIIFFWIGVSILTFSCTSFWSRYLLIVIPFVYIIGMQLLTTNTSKNIQYTCIGLCLIFNISNSYQILFPTSESSFSQFSYALEHQLFSDIYFMSDANTTYFPSWQEFNAFGIKTFTDAQIEKIQVQTTYAEWSNTASSQVIPVTLTLTTQHLGSLQHETLISMVKKDNRWKVIWNWEMLLPSLTHSSTLETILDEAKRGSIYAADGKALAYDAPSYLVSIVKGTAANADEELVYDLLKNAFYPPLTRLFLNQRVAFNKIDGQKIALGVLQVNYPRNDFALLKNIPGVQLTPHFVRYFDPKYIDQIGITINSHYDECCSSLYTTTSYDGQKGIEKLANDTLKGTNGGSLVIRNGTKNHVLILRTKTDGNNVHL